MAINKFRSKGTIALTLALLSGCTMVGHKYPFPAGSEPSAELKVNGGPVYLLTLNEKGCYTGKTLVDGKPDAAPVKVVPGELLMLSYEASCLLPFAFTPQQGSRYDVTVSDQPSALRGQTFLQALATGDLNSRTCTARVTDDTDDAHPAPVQARKMSVVHAGLACIKFR